MFKPSKIRLLVLPSGMFLSLVLVMFFLLVNIPFLALLSLLPAVYGLGYIAPVVAFGVAWCYEKAFRNSIYAVVVASSLRYRSRSVGLGVLLLFYICVAAIAAIGLTNAGMLRGGRSLGDHDQMIWLVTAMLICGVVVMYTVIVIAVRDRQQLASLLKLRGVEGPVAKKLIRIKVLWLIGPFAFVGCFGGVVVAVIITQVFNLRPTDAITYHAPVIFLLYLVATLVSTELHLGLKMTFSSVPT